jgi:lipase ATG15
VCDCYTGETYKCNLTCLENEVASEAHYYNTALHIYFNVTAQYPNANLWLTGHSLGGSLASLMGLTFGVPTVTFEAPPERLASRRLHLPAPPALKPEDMLIWHYGHTADPVFMGVCTVPQNRFGWVLMGRVLRRLVGMGGMRWSRLVIRGWSVYMIR